VKALELSAIKPRTRTNLALGHAVAPIGPRHDICEHDLDHDPHFGWPHALANSRMPGIFERLPMQHPGPDRPFLAGRSVWRTRYPCRPICNSMLWSRRSRRRGLTEATKVVSFPNLLIERWGGA